MTEDLETQVQEMTEILAKISGGNLTRRLPIPADPDHPLGALARGMNEVVAAWRAAELKARTAKKDLQSKLALVENQAAAIRELATPMIEIWDGTLLVPIVGTLAARSVDLDAILDRIAATQATCVIIDATGVAMVDTETASRLLEIVRAAGLLGASCVLTGVSPAIAQTLITLGADLSVVPTARNLRAALRARVAETSGPEA
jgi:rsbT co-antagonist protein RsbR